jgi:uncharacterized protein (TIGR03086 family)
MTTETGTSEDGTSGDVLEAALRALRETVAGVVETDWHRPTPCDKWNVTQVVQHAVGDQLGWAGTITAGPMPTEDPFAPSGHIDGSPLALVDHAVEVSAAAWATVDHDAGDVPTPLPQGPMPAWLAAGACALDAAVHAWDIAVATGQPSPLTADLARPLRTVAANIVEPLRPYGAYAAVLEAQAADDDAGTLLRYLGRRPDWTA